jgi:hypothetical protein
MKFNLLIEALEINEKEKLYILLKQYFEVDRLTLSKWANQNKDIISTRLYNLMITFEKDIKENLDARENRFYKKDWIYIDKLNEEILERIRGFGPGTIAELIRLIK